MQATVKAVIFDLDGVIIDSNPEIERFWKIWADRENIPLTGELICEWIYGRKVEDTLLGLFHHFTDIQQQEILEAALLFDAGMRPPAIAGVLDFIQALRKQKVPVGVVTSSHHSRMLRMLQHIGIDTAFTHFVTAHDVTHGKPHPEPYQKMREKMKVSCEECLVFEDAISGILSARAAGMHAIGIGNYLTSPGLFTAGACDVIPDFTFMTVNSSGLSAAGRTGFGIG